VKQLTVRSPLKLALFRSRNILDHSTGDNLCGLLIFVKRVDMTMIALDAQRAGDKGHGWFQLRGRHSLENLNVPEIAARWFARQLAAALVKM
jgi:hypothetical protein